MNLKKIFPWILYSFLFLLPWQTRWIYDPVYLNGGFFEYGSGSLYGTEILLWIILIIFFVDLFRKKEILREVLSGRCHSDRPAHGRGAEESLGDGERDPSARLGMTIGYRMTMALWGGGVVQGIFAIWQFFTQHIGANKWLGLAEHGASDLGAFVIESGGERWLRAYGSFGSPNALGIYLAVVLVIGLSLYVKLSFLRKQESYTGNKIPAFAGMTAITIGQLFILSGLILSFSRGAWVAALAGVAVLLFVIASGAKQSHGFTAVIPAEVGIQSQTVIPAKAGILSKEKDSRFRGNDSGASQNDKKDSSFRWNDKSDNEDDNLSKIAKQLFFYFLIIIFFFIVLKPLFITRIDAIGRLEIKSITERVSQIAEWKNIFLAHPLLGVGLNKYTQYLHDIHPNLPVWQYQPIHNVYLLELAELGILGMTIFAVIWFFFFKFVWQKNRIYLSVLITLLVAGLFDHWLWSMFTGVVFWWVVLLLCFTKSKLLP